MLKPQTPYGVGLPVIYFDGATLFTVGPEWLAGQLLCQDPEDSQPAHLSGLLVQRKVARLRVSRDLAGLLLGDSQRAIKHLQKNPALKTLRNQNAGGYHHN